MISKRGGDFFMFETILLEEQGAITWLKINRPDVRNALNEKAYEEISEAIHYVNTQPETKVVVITGVGEKSFAAGADINQLKNRSAIDTLIPGLQGVCKQIEQSSKVFVAAINGYALGGGLEVALACDIRIAADHAKFGLPELNLAIIPSGGGTQRLSRIIGKGRALDLILTGKMVTAQQAEQYGLITHIVAFEKLVEETTNYVQSILKKGPLALQLAKQVVHQGFDLDLTSALLLEKLAQGILYASDDKREGTSAFIEKRTAQFSGK